MDAGTASPQTSITLRGVGRCYGKTVALDGVDLDIRKGAVHAIIGENGAGKSTCLSILAGRVVPSSGEVRFFGAAVPPGDPRAARRAGIAAVYQELTIVPGLSTQANVFLGQDLSRRGVIRESEMRRRLEELSADMGVRVPVDVPAASLSVSDRQLIETLRGLASDPRVILFDEPTAALAPREREALHHLIRELRDRGVTIVIVSHNLDEVLALSDTVTVFRNGRVVSTKPAGEWTKPALVSAMIGRDLRQTVRSVEHREITADAPALRVEGVTTRRLRDIAFEVRPGEVVGVAGLVGSGRSSLLKALAGELPGSSGRMWIEGRAVAWPTSTRRARRAGITLVPDDRKEAGLFHDLSAAENIAIASLPRSSRFGIVSRARAREAARAASRTMGFDPARLGDTAGRLSGGNQQKLLLARAVLCEPTVLLADEPTRGIDVGAKADIMRTVRTLAAEGMAVVAVSSELEDLELLCDRVIVLAGGEVVGRIDDQREITVNAMLERAFRLEEEAA